MEHVRALQSLNAIQNSIPYFKTFLKDTLNSYCETALSTPMFHLLLHVIENFNRIGAMQLFNSPAYEHFNVHSKLANCTTLQQRTFAPEDTLSPVETATRNRGQELYKMQMAVRSAIIKFLAGVSATGPFHVRDGSPKHQFIA